MTLSTRQDKQTNTQPGLALKKIALPLMVATGIAMASAPAVAGKYRNNNTTKDYAKVVDVKPVYETFEVNHPVQHCYDERVPVRDSRRHSRYERKYHRDYDSKTPEIVGGIIGGAIGNRIGKKGGGKARDVATVVGAVLGGSIGRDVKHKNRYKRDRYYRDDYHRDSYDRYETVKRCETRDSYTTKKEIVGYDVAYKYRGNIYHSHFNEHPGDRVKVRVTVDPY